MAPHNLDTRGKKRIKGWTKEQITPFAEKEVTQRRLNHILESEYRYHLEKGGTGYVTAQIKDDGGIVIMGEHCYEMIYTGGGIEGVDQLIRDIYYQRRTIQMRRKEAVTTFQALNGGNKLRIMEDYQDDESIIVTDGQRYECWSIDLSASEAEQRIRSWYDRIRKENDNEAI